MNIKLQKRLISTSIDLADFTDYTQRHFSFLLLRNKVICTGINDRNKTNPIAKKFGFYQPNIHSEVACLLNAPIKVRDLRRFTMVNIRIDQNNNLMLSRPCKFCQRVLASFGISQLWYSTGEGEFDEFQ